MQRDLKLLIIDPSPIVLLRSINKLELFTLPKLDIYITDVVYGVFFENDSPFDKESHDFIRQYACIKPTELGETFMKALFWFANAQLVMDPIFFSDRIARSMVEMLNDDLLKSNKYLVLTSNYKAFELFNRERNPEDRFHCIDTQIFLYLLEKYEFIDSAKEIIATIEVINGKFEKPYDSIVNSLFDEFELFIR